MTNFKLILCYDGSRYRGWQRQGNTPNTIQAKLETLLSDLLGLPIEVAGSGRTDAGVHARRQTVSFRADTDLTPDELLSRLRARLPEDIGAVSLEAAPPRFHARLSCRRKTYLYRIWTGDEPCVFERKYVWQVTEPLDLERMRRAADHLIGEHDFAAFHTGPGKKSTVRRIDSIKISADGSELHVRFTGNGFLYNMVRILTGTLIEVGAGRLDPDRMPEILAGKDRQNAGPTAPARGLFLWETVY